MSVKTISRTALALSSSQCTFTHIVPTIIGRRTITGPIGNLTRPSHPRPKTHLTTNHHPASRSSPQPFQKRRQPPPHKLSDYQNSPSTQERHDLVDRIRSSNYSPQNKARQASISRTEVDRHALNVAIERQQFRRWKPGDVYAPHDLSSVEMRKWSKRRGVQGDVFEALDLDPRSEYKVRFLHIRCSVQCRREGWVV